MRGKQKVKEINKQPKHKKPSKLVNICTSSLHNLCWRYNKRKARCACHKFSYYKRKHGDHIRIGRKGLKEVETYNTNFLDISLFSYNHHKVTNDNILTK